MYKASLKEKFRYQFDNIMAKGTIALVGILFLITAIVIILAGFVGFLVGGGDIGSNIWISIMHTIDAGTITGTDTGNVGFIILMSIVTLCGLFVTSILIGIITTGFEERLNSLKKGNSKVIEQNHTVILGFNDNIYTIISELCEANLNHKNSCVVVLAPEEKELMETAISEQIQDLKTTRVICRTGQITDMHMLKQCSIEQARSIIINEDRDFITTKAILTVNNYFSTTPNSRGAHIVATVSDNKNYEVAEIAGEGNVELILVQDAVSRIIAQTCRQSGLSNVLIELFDYSGNELYFENFPSLAGKKFKEVVNLFEYSVVFGYKRGDDILLNPDKESVLIESDELLLLTEDDGFAKPTAVIPSFDSIGGIMKSGEEELRPESILILGTNTKLKKILCELDSYFDKGSKVVIADLEEPQEGENLADGLSNMQMSFKECDTTDRVVLDELLIDNFNHVLLLSDDNLDTETADAVILLKLIHLRDISHKTGRLFNITSEMKNTTNQKLAKVAEVNDLIIGSNIVNLILTQISENRDLSTVFKELLHPYGSEIYMRRAANYLALDTEVDFFTISEIAMRHNEIAIGYKKQSGDNFEIINCPRKSSKVTFGEEDYIIVLASD